MLLTLSYLKVTPSELSRYSWPGNVRELMHVVESLVVLGPKMILPEHLPREISEDRFSSDEVVPLRDAVREVERRYIRRALERTGYNKTRAARLLGISVNTLKAKMRKYGM